MKTLDKNQKGFVALFTVLLVSVILAMAIGIASISLKEIVLSSSATEGSKAFYSADSGIECALFYDRVNSAQNAFFSSDFECNGNVPINPQASADFESPEVYTFEIPFGAEDELCASVTVKRQLTSSPSYSTIIESKGTNLPCDENDNPKRVERSIRVTY